MSERPTLITTTALELNAPSNIWTPDIVEQMLDLMVDTGFDTLVFNEVGVIERLVYPGEYFLMDGVEDRPGPGGVHRRYRNAFRELYRHDPGRRSRPYQNMEYMRRVARSARNRDIRMYLNNKELFYPDGLLRRREDLLVDGRPCPTAPGWFEFLETKYENLYSDFPELTGMITSIATGESRLSIAAGWCPCRRCADTDPADWYHQVMAAMYRPAQRHGKTLVVRDFVFTRHDQDELSRGLEGLPDDIVVCLKNTPHDYYPTFPDNPRIGVFRDHPQWVEFDAMGQYFGWGVAPAVMIEDMRARLDHSIRNGVDGVLMRIDWEGLEGHHAMRNYNVLNIHGLGALARDPNVPSRDVYRAWAERWGMLAQDADDDTREDAVRWLVDVFERCWPITSRTLFAHDCVFSDSSQFPVSIDHAFWLAEEKNSLKDWDPSRADALSIDADNVRALLEEKGEAVRLVELLAEEVRAGHSGLDQVRMEELAHRFDVFAFYVRAFDAAARGIFAGRHRRDSTEPDPELADIAAEAPDRIRAIADEIRRTRFADWHPAATALSPDRLETLADDLQAALAVAPA